MPDSSTGRQVPETEVLAYFVAHPLGTRLFVRIRKALFPFEQVLAQVPDGKLLDVGCGHGVFSLLVASRRPDSMVVGVDPDRRKIMALERAAAALQNLRFICGRLENVAERDFDSAALLDVLMYLPPAKQMVLIDEVRQRLARGGTLLLAMNDKQPRWKYAITYLQESCMRLCGLTHAEALHFVSPEWMASQLASAGFAVTVRQLTARGLYPHKLLLARKI